MSDSQHSMITRSKQKIMDINHQPPQLPEEDIDEHGNVSDLMDYECDEDFDNEMFQKELNRLRGNKKVKPLHFSPKKKSRKKKNNPIGDLFLSYMLTSLLNPKLDKRSRKKKKDIQENIIIDIVDEEEIDSESEIELTSSEESEEEDISDDESEEDNDDESEELEGSDEELESSEETGEESESEVEMDEFDEQYIDMEEEELEADDIEFTYFQNLEKDIKQKHLNSLKEIKEVRNTDVPLKFKILNSHMDIKTKSIAIGNIEKLEEMDVSTGEYCKMDKWINGLINIPFGKYNELPINNENTLLEKRKYILNTQKQLDKAIFGHEEAKMHILQVIGKWIKNPKSQGNVLAIQGPMGNGKTTLVKEGIAKAINRPFAFIALGGASDSAFFDGHSYTYEGSHWGRVVDILIDSKCMNPIIYFDELDKISDTHKGDEITHLLTHLTDPSQNSLFQDNYFPGIHLDLSKALFIFSFNDESKVDRILKDRMYVINTKGFKPKDKIEICRNYVLPELLDTFLFTSEEIVFSDEAIIHIIEKYTGKEEGVRNLKRCLETIISKINIYYLSDKKNEDKNENDKIPLTFTIKDFTLPINITEDIVKELLPCGKNEGQPPEHMYM
jgi:ATP-dependent Lon protease